MDLRLVGIATVTLALASGGRAAAPSQTYSHGDPTNDEQLSLELINRARANPTTEGIFLSDINDPTLNFNYTFFNVNRPGLRTEFAPLPARPPLAFNSKLIAASRTQTQVQIAGNFQGHANPFGQNLIVAGYNYAVVGENVFARVPSVFFAHVGLNVDFGLNNDSSAPGYLSHRKTIMSIAPEAVYKEIGIGFAAASGTNTTPNVITQSFGIELGETNTPYLTGVVFRDLDNNSFYTVGEGLAGVTVMPEEGTFSTVTSASGGYAIPLKALTPGAATLKVTFSGGALTSPVVRTLGLNGTNNLKADVMVGKPRVVNLSTRVRVEGGENVGIAGFVIGGTNAKRVLIRSLGPSLAGFGIANPLANPSLELRDPVRDVLIAQNDNWKSSQQAVIAASGFPPNDDAEAGIVVTLQPGSYTAIVSGNGGSGVAIVEVYDLETSGTSYSINVSTRGIVRTGENVLIGGFVLPATKKVIVRGIGPSLTGFGIVGALANPTIELKNSSGTTLATNDSWRSTQQAEIQASGFAPTNDAEAAIVQTLPAGSYTVIVSGVAGGNGVGLFEVYDLD